ncbi:MAG: GNAT family protein [Candidatus Peribacteraceae bacterium]|nr:GNAT family protein [Candidatus Peribacteraceae bacterium]MDD5740045.1 GNAT family protein [Candidatus Peribacteraceae bacterium]
MTPFLKLRPATKEDSRLLFEWANDPEVRATAFSTEQIPWEDHVRWLEKKLLDSHCTIWIALDETMTPIGQIRFDLQDKNAEVDVHLAPGQRGKGYGTLLIAEGLHSLFRSTKCVAVHSFVKADNTTSRQAFLRAGFQEQGMEHMHGQEVYHFLCKRP